MSEDQSRVEPREFRAIMGHYPTGVTIVTTTDSAGEPMGFTANSVTSVSLEPPLLLVCLAKTSNSLGAIMERGAFTVNILDAGSAPLATLFAKSDNRERRFEGVSFTEDPLGNPAFDSGLAWLACELYTTFEAGDHVVLVGHVKAGEANGGEPLLFFRGQYGRLKQ